MRGGDLLRFGEPLQRDQAHQLLANLRRNTRGHAGVGAAGCNTVDADFVATPLERQRPRQPDDARLGGGVVGLANVAEHRDRGRIDDAAATLRAQVRLRRLGHQERALQVDVQYLIPLRFAEFDGQGVAVDPGVVDDDVQSAERLDRPLHERGRVGRAADVAGQGERSALVRLD